jgi:nucleolar protein 15
MSKLIRDAAETRKRIRAQAESEAENAVVDTVRKVNTRTVAAGKVQGNKVRGKVPKNESKVIYLGHIPHGFYEKEMSKFFGQFGDVKRVKLFRSPKTGKSKGYAFVEFKSADVAVVASQALDGYLLHDRQLVSHVVAPEKLHEGMFLPNKKPTKENLADSDNGEYATEEEGQEETEHVSEKQQKKRARSLRLKQQKFKELGIDFPIPGL